MGGLSLTYFIVRQLPVLRPSAYLAAAPWAPCQRRRLAVFPDSRTNLHSWDMRPFAEDCGDTGVPFYLGA